jgi:hypothetical protein
MNYDFETVINRGGTLSLKWDATHQGEGLSPVIPLCTEHHRGNSSIHGLGRKQFERTFKTTEEELLEMVSAKFPPPIL